ncbi:hypothetical protein [Cryptosporangium sp. NPDC048952]|uniref:hypothetical protein n=1 Tax=Cryptosporangium sp. NPDC048952 TaxID=3363961 RepID=UPI00371C48D2
MTSLWLSFSGKTKSATAAGAAGAARPFLASSFPPPAVAEITAVITQVIGQVLDRSPGGGELIVSRREDTMLIEILDQHPASKHPTTGPNNSRTSSVPSTCGSLAVAGGTVTWIEIPLP